MGICPGDQPNIIRGISFSKAVLREKDFTIAMQDVQIALALVKVVGGKIFF